MREVGGVNPVVMQAMAGLTVMVLWTAAYAKANKPASIDSQLAGRTRVVTRSIQSIKGRDLCTNGRLSSAACLDKLP